MSRSTPTRSQVIRSTTAVAGTSSGAPAAPLRAAYTARVNQQRTYNGMEPVGFANPAIYQLAGSSHGGALYDIADGSTNLYYPAIAGYDNATGWGSFNGANLLAELARLSQNWLWHGLSALPFYRHNSWGFAPG